MLVFFLSTGLRTNWSVGGQAVFLAAGLLLFAPVSGKSLGVHIADRILRWEALRLRSSAGCCRPRR